MSESLELTSPDSIVVEYLHSRDPEVRRNAATAAGVLATEETMTCLVEIALHDEDPKVRESAVAELIRLGERLNQVSTNVLAPKLRDRRERAATYALLGKLKNHGVQLTLPAFSFKKRLAMAWTLFPSLYAKKLVKLRRAIKPASLGALLGLLIALIVGGFSLAMSLGTELLLGILGIGAMSIPVAALVSSRATPLALHYYRAAGLVAEVLAAAAGSAAAMVPLELPAVVALFAGKPGMFIKFSEFTSATIVWAVRDGYCSI